jgi:hypothetical protein
MHVLLTFFPNFHSDNSFKKSDNYGNSFSSLVRTNLPSFLGFSLMGSELRVGGRSQNQQKKGNEYEWGLSVREEVFGVPFNGFPNEKGHLLILASYWNKNLSIWSRDNTVFINSLFYLYVFNCLWLRFNWLILFLLNKRLFLLFFRHLMDRENTYIRIIGDVGLHQCWTLVNALQCCFLLKLCRHSLSLGWDMFQTQTQRVSTYFLVWVRTW